jgi:hypothetical protein
LLSQQQLSEFCHETLVVAAKYQQDFEKFGIHLRDSQQRAKVAQLLALNQHFPALFNATLVSQLAAMRVDGLSTCPTACGMDTVKKHHSAIMVQVPCSLRRHALARHLAPPFNPTG